MRLPESIEKTWVHLYHAGSDIKKYPHYPKLIMGRILLVLHRRNFVPRRIRRKLLLLKYKYFSVPVEFFEQPEFTINSSEIFLDIGANRGWYSRLLSPRCLVVHAWEPNPRIAGLLREQTRELGNVIVHQEGLGAEEGTFPFNVHEVDSLDSFVFQRAHFAETVPVHVKRLDSYSFSGRVGLVKVDTEGFEVEVILGGLETIRKHKPKLVLEMHEPHNANAEMIMGMLPEYKWRRRQRPPHSRYSPFHLVGEPK